MSNAFAQVFTPEGELLGFTVYQGSADLCWPSIEPEFCWEHDEWRVCDHEGEPCIVYEDYGGGCWFESRYCPVHRCLTGAQSEWGDPIDGKGGLPLDVIRERTGEHPFPDKKDCTLVGSLGAPGGG